MSLVHNACRVLSTQRKVSIAWKDFAHYTEDFSWTKCFVYHSMPSSCHSGKPASALVHDFLELNLLRSLKSNTNSRARFSLLRLLLLWQIPWLGFLLTFSSYQIFRLSFWHVTSILNWLSTPILFLFLFPFFGYLFLFWFQQPVTLIVFRELI
jgi:hypothetical protein